MAKRKLTKTVAGAARPETVPYEVRDTVIPGFLLKGTPTGRKIFMLAYVANDGQRPSTRRCPLPKSRARPPGVLPLPGSIGIVPRCDPSNIGD
jgi:hypothetical protein